MSKFRFKVLQKFPFWRIKDDDIKIGMIFEVTLLKGRWPPEVGGAYFLPDSPKESKSIPDFSGARLAYLHYHKYIELL